MTAKPYHTTGAIIGTVIGAGVGVIAYSFVGAAAVATSWAAPVFLTVSAAAAMYHWVKGDILAPFFLSLVGGTVATGVQAATQAGLAGWLETIRAAKYDLTNPIGWAIGFGWIGGVIGEVVANRLASPKP